MGKMEADKYVTIIDAGNAKLRGGSLTSKKEELYIKYVSLTFVEAFLIYRCCDDSCIGLESLENEFYVKS